MVDRRSSRPRRWRSHDRRGRPAGRGRPPRRPARPAVLLPEGGVGPDRRADPPGRRARRPRGHDRHGRAVPGDARDLAGLRAALRRRGRHGGRPAPGRPLDGRRLLRRREGRRARARARRRRGLDHRHPPRPGAHARARAARRARRGPRAVEVQPARGLDRRGRLGPDRRARPALPRAARRGATPRSAARPAPPPARGARGGGPAWTRPSADCMCRRSSGQAPEAWIPSSSCSAWAWACSWA